MVVPVASVPSIGVAETAMPAVVMRADLKAAAFVAGVSALLAAPGNRWSSGGSIADAPSPASVEGFGVPGSVWQLACPAAVDIFGPLKRCQCSSGRTYGAEFRSRDC